MRLKKKKKLGGINSKLDITEEKRLVNLKIETIQSETSKKRE